MGRCGCCGRYDVSTHPLKASMPVKPKNRPGLARARKNYPTADFDQFSLYSAGTMIITDSASDHFIACITEPNTGSF